MIAGHTHDFTEVLRDDKTGTELRCKCGARLWVPVSALEYLSQGPQAVAIAPWRDEFGWPHD